jgi:hypothetical protein
MVPPAKRRPATVILVARDAACNALPLRGCLLRSGMPKGPSGSGGLAHTGAAGGQLVGVAGCLVDAAAGQPPGHDAGLRLVEVPAGGLLGLMVPAAQWREVAFAGPARRLGDYNIPLASVRKRIWR